MAKEQKETKKVDKNSLFAHRKSLADLLNTNTEYRITTKSLTLDLFLGGGFRPGVMRFAAPEEHGKSAMAMEFADSFLTHFHSKGEKAKIIYFDAECRLFGAKLMASPIVKNKYFKCNGGEDDTFEIYTWNRYEPIAKYLYDQARENQGKDACKIMFIIDSMDALFPECSEDKEFGEAEKIAAAQTISTVLMKKIAPYIEGSGHSLYICSQLRANVDMSNPNSPKTRVSGGHMLLHSTSLFGVVQPKTFSLIFQNENGKTLAEKGAVIGHYMNIKFLKTFNDKSDTLVKVPIKRGHGVWVERELADIAIKFDLIKKSGAWFSMAESLAQDIDENLPAFEREFTIKAALQEEINKLTKESEKPPTEKQIQKKKEELSASIQLKPFKVETKWQGMPTVYKYLEETPELVRYLCNSFKKTLTVDGERTEDATEIDV